MEEADPMEQNSPGDETNDEKPLGVSDDNKTNGEIRETVAMDSAEPEAPLPLEEDENGETLNMESETDRVVLEGEDGICTENTNQSNNGESNSVPDKMTMEGQLESSEEAKYTLPDVQGTDDSESNICEHANLGEKVISNENSEKEETEHVETNHTNNNNMNCNGINDDVSVGSDEGSKDQSKISDPGSDPSLSSDTRRKGLLQSDPVFSERISSDGGSVEIAEEAEEEDCSASDQVNADDRILPPLDGGDKSENNIQHSKEVTASSSVTIETRDTLETSPAVESSILIPHSDDCQSTPPQTNKEPALHLPGLAPNELEARSDPSSSLGVTKSDSETAVDVEDDLLSELAAELDEVVPEKTVGAVAVHTDLPSSETRSIAEVNGEGRFKGGDDIIKMRRLVEEWKKKYCHAEAELQR